MKIDKTLLAAMLMGISSVGLSSCEKVEIQKEVHECTYGDDGTCADHPDVPNDQQWGGEPCPTCGMG